jgi:CBS-domain-containing membrane protein
VNDIQHLHPDKNTPILWRRCIIQSLYAILVIFLLILLLRTNGMVIITSMAASTFIVFARPHSNPARGRNLVGGHFIGLVIGLLFGLVPRETTLIYELTCALSVGFTIFLMAISATEHPPAAGTALAVSMTSFSINVVLSLVVCIIVLALAHHLLRAKLVNLL